MTSFPALIETPEGSAEFDEGPEDLGTSIRTAAPTEDCRSRSNSSVSLSLRRMQTSHPSSPRVIFSAVSAMLQSSENTVSLGSKKHERSPSIHIAVREQYTDSPTFTSLTQRMESPTRASGSLAGIGCIDA